jgi:hypothetical protein
MVNVGIFYDNLEYFTAIWYNLWPLGINIWPFGKVCGNLEYFSQFGMFGPRKIWQPWSWLRSGRAEITRYDRKKKFLIKEETVGSEREWLEAIPGGAKKMVEKMAEKMVEKMAENRSKKWSKWLLVFM